MVYVIVVYDMQADRTHLLLKFLRRYLTHVQNSVFEGEVTEGDLETIETRIDSILEPDESTIIYEVSSEKLLQREVFGDDPTEDQRFL
ncbi:CRISPR-associated endonuclease Cas2 [Halorussus salilacus]|uniref:CRISPR-associated endonuclease Cas2 n=1 Tax=Halorussus salilacus TaxID=2953750 RepID=UPI0020A054CA|nr:CRISPR-associated endonuclease Cas2 [Halorussus salilacus]USZ68380.1 CRISPR-associated endonuclease Cas2 [Halorussus salilacus]